MQATEGLMSIFPNSPCIFDTEMGDNVRDPDIDFEFFHDPEAPTSPSMFLPEDLTTNDTLNYTEFESSKIKKHPNPLINQAAFLGSSTRSHLPVLSAATATSPAASSHDSSSVSSGSKRKASGSDSSQSALTPGDTVMPDDTDMRDWKVDDMMTGGDVPNYSGFNGSGIVPFNGTIDPSKMTKDAYEFSDKSMENDFDFESAASSPSPFATGQSSQVESPETQTVRFHTQVKTSPKIKTQFRHNKANSQYSMTNSMNGLTTSGSREASPLSAMVTSQESSPSALFNSPSPNDGGGVEYIHGSLMNSAVSPHTAWNPQFNSQNGLPAAQFPVGNPSMPLPNPQNTGYPPAGAPPNLVCQPRLTIHPTPLKSRVETQIPIKVTLFPIPPGITKLHLPKHTISKPKLLSKPPPEKSSDTLELSTMLVCSSAMQNQEKRRRAFTRAANGPPYQTTNSRRSESQESTTDEDDESKPLNGGEVQICGGCITRERKRAARKKVKKAEDEDAWHKDEHKRVIVFNTHEIKDWQAPSSQPPSEATGDRAEPMVPEGAMQVDAPMRIACYCRHQNEKLGFQVIFTIKDHLGRLVAQEITSSIMITDDHKTHNMPPMLNQDSNGSDGMGLPTQRSFSADPAYNMLPASSNGMTQFRMSHSGPDLQSLQQQQYPVQYQQHGMNTNSASHPSQSTSASLTPRNLSRSGSPSGSNGPSSKKRKASGSITKVPTGLAMTKMENQPAQTIPSALPSAGVSSITSPYTPAFGSFQQSPEHQFNLPIAPNTQHFNTGPPTPNSNDNTMLSNANRSHSMENLPVHQLYSAPASAHQSRAPSPNGLRHQAYQQQAQIAQAAQAVANGIYGMPLSLNPHRPPTIHKLIPFEGPRAGGIEVTCLGSGFCQGLEVMFGENKATTTTYWGETSLVCLLPPAASAGTVAVTFKHHQQVPQFPAPAIPKQQVLFKYVDDDEQQIIRMALTVLNHKMTGRMEDIRDIAKRVVGEGLSSWNANGQNGNGAQSQHGNNLGSTQFEMDSKDVEGSLLKVLDLIDLDDSPYMPRLNYRRSSGQTMLHLACSLGLHRFVAAILARGANPEPRDKGGFTPMHFAALHNHPQIVRRLILGGADPTMRSLLGYTPADLATSEEVLRATRRIEHHSRTRSSGSIRSRNSSIASLRSLWEPLSITQSNVMQGTTDGPEDGSTDAENDDDEDPYNPDDAEADSLTMGGMWRHPTHTNAARTVSSPIISDNPAHLGVPEAQNPPGFVSPTAAMAAFREQMSAHFQNIQQTMHLNFSNLPNLPPMQMPTLPDYQAYLPANPMVRRISSMVPHMGASRPISVTSADGKEHDYKWWDLFSGAAPAAPPAYDDIFPDTDMERKRSSAAQAAADAVADNKCATLFDEVETEAETSPAVDGSNTALETVHIGRKHPVSQEVQTKLRLAHAEKVKRIKSDRNLFFIWIPLLVVVMIAMGYNRVPQLTEFLLNRFNSHTIGVH